MPKNKNKKLQNLKDVGLDGLKDIATSFSKMKFKDSDQKTPTTATGPRKMRRGEKEIKESFDPVPKEQAGLLVTGALEEALAECKAKVERIARQCRAANRKFRDVEFDLEKDQWLCRYGLFGNEEDEPDAAVKRVTEIFDKPVFFGPDGPNASDVRQGDLGDCWFLAALSAVSTVPGLVEKFCVARDEEVGVYGFIFFRDCYWQPVIIDDLLFWSPPKFDELTLSEKQLYHNERHVYHQVVEKSGKGLKYARSGVVGETWVPLIEKAYAKFHGDYAALDGGFLSDGIEDLTGAVATSFQMSDLLSPDRFWTHELQHADLKTRLFGVSLNIDEARSQVAQPTVQGLFPAHAYSVLRARECNGKRFVVVRNPWGESEWTGAWGDGSKEWKGEWLGILKDLDHEFGDDGQFVMEYSDFLEVFGQVDRATLFDASWVMSSLWLRIPPQPSFHPWTYGDAFYYFSLDKASSVVVVLSQTDHRYFQKLNGEYPWWLLDFVVFKKGSPESIGMSGISLGSQRSVSCELYLEAGDYVVLPRVEPRSRGSVSVGEDDNEWDIRKLSRMLTERAKSRSFAANYDLSQEIDYLPITPEVAFAIGLDSGNSEEDAGSDAEDETEEPDKKEDDTNDAEGKENAANSTGDADSDSGGLDFSPDDGPKSHPLFLGLRVYTQDGAVATVSGGVKEG
ncbi:cysteine proteinase [Pholiota conissans]|uniref:Cysteine proteinase n=1 Tax=Pholiota conissans TaxID=109636 RepID=A0A9P6CV59_9AGAR|nr:cysteine proteinase [Pholiota conissans]